MRETITFRPKRSKRQLQDVFGNVSDKRWLFSLYYQTF